MMKDMSSYLSVVSGVIYVHNYRRFLQNPMKIKEDMQMPKNGECSNYATGSCVHVVVETHFVTSIHLSSCIIIM